MYYIKAPLKTTLMALYKSVYYYYYYYYYFLAHQHKAAGRKTRLDILLLLFFIFLNLGKSSRGGRQKLILEIIALMVNHPSGSHQQRSHAAG